MHKVQERPVVVGGEIQVRPMMYVALSYDHRVIDGAEAVSFLVRINPVMTVIALVPLAGFGFVSIRAFQTLRPAFRERGKIRAEVTGRLTEALGGIRVIKGFHAIDKQMPSKIKPTASHHAMLEASAHNISPHNNRPTAPACPQTAWSPPKSACPPPAGAPRQA